MKSLDFVDIKQVIHDSPLGSIQYVKIKNKTIRLQTNFIVFKVKKLTSDEVLIKQLYSDILSFYKKCNVEKIQFAQIYDFTETESSNIYDDIQFGRNYGNFLRDSAEKMLTECCIGTSIIVNSELIKGLVNSALFFYSNVKPTKVHSSLEESYEWLWPLIRFNGN